MKKRIVTLLFMLVFGIASAQVNKVDPVQAVTPPGTPPMQNATQQINKGQERDGSPTAIISSSPASNVPSSSTTAQPSQRVTPTSSNGTTAPNPGQTLAYPTEQKAMQPGTGITTGEASGTNNPLNTLPAKNTTNQGKLP